MTGPIRRERLRVMEAYRNLFYTPIYVAVAGGFLHKQGLDVLFSTVPAGQTNIGLLKDGQADIIQTGLSRSFMDLDQGHDDPPLHVAEINQRDGFFLLSSRPTGGWGWTDLEGSTLIPIGFTPVPWMSLKFAMKKRGVAIEKVRLIEGLGAAEAIQRFSNGEADYIHMVNPYAQQLIDDGAGHLVAAIGPELGYICYSSFAVTPATLSGRPDMIGSFVRGFYEAQKWLAASDAEEVASTVAGFFPEIDKPVLERSIRRYKDQRTWAEDPLIREEGFEGIRDVLIDGGLVKGRWTYNRLVRPEFALVAIDA